MRQRQIEQPGFSGCIAGLAEVEPAAKGGDPLRQGFRAERDRLPVEAIAGDRNDVLSPSVMANWTIGSASA
jgi:hypothetical protein